MRKGRIIVVLPSAKLILSVDGGKFTSEGIFLTKSNQFITKKKFGSEFLDRIICGDLMVQLPYFGTLGRITVRASRQQ